MPSNPPEIVEIDLRDQNKVGVAVLTIYIGLEKWVKFIGVHATRMTK